MKTELIHTTRKSKSILLFSPYFELFRTIDILPYKPFTQGHVDGAQRAWASCDRTRYIACLEVYVNLKLQYIVQVPSLSILFIQLHVVSSFTFGILFTTGSLF